VAVESLAIGDLVMTGSGEAKPIKWIDRRNDASRFTIGQRQILRVRIRAGALGDVTPKRESQGLAQISLFIFVNGDGEPRAAAGRSATPAG
jgi:hypothetical protein